MNNYLVFLEQREGLVKKASIDVWNHVQELAAVHGNSVVSGILIGGADIRQLEGDLCGDGTIYHANEEIFSLYNSEYYARLVTDIVREKMATTLFFADTTLGRELAPILSVRLDASLLQGCPISDAAGEDGGCSRPVYSASAMAYFVPERSFRIYTISSCDTHPVALAKGHISFITFNPALIHTQEEFFPMVRQLLIRENGRDVSEARVIIAGGRGVGSADGFAILEELAQLLGGVVGASRQVVDEGWRPHCEQIGQTGKTVAPKLYFACGISGSLQHSAGIGAAETVIAINSDRHAPIFDVADYGIVGDLHLVLPKLVDALKEFLKRK